MQTLKTRLDMVRFLSFTYKPCCSVLDFLKIIYSCLLYAESMGEGSGVGEGEAEMETESDRHTLTEKTDTQPLHRDIRWRDQTSKG